MFFLPSFVVEDINGSLHPLTFPHNTEMCELRGLSVAYEFNPGKDAIIYVLHRRFLPPLGYKMQTAALVKSSYTPVHKFIKLHLKIVLPVFIPYSMGRFFWNLSLWVSDLNTLIEIGYLVVPVPLLCPFVFIFFSPCLCITKRCTKLPDRRNAFY